jgi:hypothetical protein
MTPNVSPGELAHQTRERLASGMRRPSLGPFAQDLASALLGRKRERALAVLVRAANEGWEIREVEEDIIVPAVTRLGQLWLRGRFDDSTFRQIGSLAESVERRFRIIVCDQARQSRTDRAARPAV